MKIRHFKCFCLKKLVFNKTVCPDEEITVGTDPSVSPVKLIVFPKQDNGIVMSDVQEIDISSLTTGIYLLTVYDDNGNLIASEKIIKD